MGLVRFMGMVGCARPTGLAGGVHAIDSVGDAHPTNLVGDAHPTNSVGDAHPTNSVGDAHPTNSRRSPVRDVDFTWRRAAWTYLATFLAVNFVLVSGIRIGKWDAIDSFCPFFVLIADSIRHGELVLWSPLILGGCPLGLEPEVGAFSPVQLLLGLLTGGNEFGFRLYWLLIWCSGGFGILVLARHLGAAAWGACIGAIGYAFSAIFMSHAQHTSYLLTMSLFPWALWRFDAAILRRSWICAAQAGAIWGLSGLGGYPSLILGGAGFATVWGVGRLLFARGIFLVSSEGVSVQGWANEDVIKTGTGTTTDCIFGNKNVQAVVEPVPVCTGPVPGLVRRAAFVGLALATFMATGCAVLSPLYLGFLMEGRGYTSRVDEMSRDTALGGGMPPAATTTLASPYLLIWNNKGPQPAFRADLSLASIYLSPLLLTLAFQGVAATGNRRFAWFIGLVAVFYLLLAMAGATPLYGWFLDLVPPARYVRLPAGFRCFFVFAMTVLALFAVGSANEPQTGNRADGFWKRMATTSTGLGVLAFAAFAAIVWASAGGQNANSKALLALATASLVGMWSAVAALSIWGYRGGEEIRHRILGRYFVLLAIADAALTMGLSESTVCGPRSQWNATAAEHVASPDLTERGLDREFSTQAAGLSRNANLASKVPSLSGYLGIVNTFHTETLDHPSLSSIALGPQRIWFSPEATRVPLTECVFHRFAEIADQRGKPCMVISDRPSCAPPSQDSLAADLPAELEDRLTALPAVEPASIHLTEYSPNRLTFDAAVPSDGWLLVTDRWAAGWESRVNGIATGVQIGNFIFRAVPVREGSNHVDFQYRPFGFPWLLGLSWLTLASVLFATLVPRLFPRSHSAV